MNSEYFSHLECVLATERLNAYRHDEADEITTLARYLLNMAICEALYSPLQFAEIALRNAIHNHLSSMFDSDSWYDVMPTGKLLRWQSQQLLDARDKLNRAGKEETPGRLVSELHFGFWTGFFNGRHARTGIGFSITNSVFSRTPQPERNLSSLDTYWTKIRTLRNRVFHHERILHWKDLDSQHANLLMMIGWINPELEEMATALDRYTAIRGAGLTPWVEKIRKHWPEK